MKIGVLSYDEHAGNHLKNISWKDINQKFKNDFDKTLEYILLEKTEEERGLLKEFCEAVLQEINALGLGYLGKKTLPPQGY